MKLRLEQRFWIPAALALPIVVLALLVGNQLLEGVQLPPDTTRKIVPPIALSAPYVLLSLDQAYNDLQQRPPFVPTRKYNRPTVSGTPKAVMPKGQFVLIGVVTSSDVRVALLRSATSNKTVRVNEGQEINGVRLEKVGNDMVILNQGGELEELRVKIQSGKPRQPAPDQNSSGETPQTRPLPGNTAPGTAPTATEPVRPPSGGKPIPRPIEH